MNVILHLRVKASYNQYKESIMLFPPSEPMSIEPCSYILLFHNHARRHLVRGVVSQSKNCEFIPPEPESLCGRV